MTKSLPECPMLPAACCNLESGGDVDTIQTSASTLNVPGRHPTAPNGVPRTAFITSDLAMLVRLRSGGYQTLVLCRLHQPVSRGARCYECPTMQDNAQLIPAKLRHKGRGLPDFS